MGRFLPHGKQKKKNRNSWVATLAVESTYAREIKYAGNELLTQSGKEYTEHFQLSRVFDSRCSLAVNVCLFPKQI
jgi:hypothetical protein